MNSKDFIALGLGIALVVIVAQASKEKMPAASNGAPADANNAAARSGVSQYADIDAWVRGGK